MKKDIAAIVCASVLLGATSMAFAGAYGEKGEAEEMPAPVEVAPAAEPEPETAYWYLQAGANFSIENFDVGGHDNGWGYNVRAGRRLCSMFAAEIHWEHIPGDFESSRGPGFDVDTWALTANGKFYPITGAVQPFALVGVGYLDGRVSGDGVAGGPDQDGFAARFGLGLDVLITDNFGVAAEVDYLLMAGDGPDLDQIPVSLGFFYNFL
jgi:hypothetical protein